MNKLSDNNCRHYLVVLRAIIKKFGDAKFTNNLMQFIYIYSGKNVNLSAKFSISVTHFQVIGLCLKLNLEYPPAVLRILRWISALAAFDFLDTASPECSTKQLTFAD